MIITIDSSGQLLLIFGIIFAIVVLSMLLKKGDLPKKVISLVIMTAVFAFVFFMFGRPTKIVMDETGLNSRVYGTIEFEWTEITDAILIENYQQTEYKPALKINGSAVKDFRAGYFRLSNGEKAKLVTQSSDDALLIRTAEKTYLFAVDELDSMIAYLSRYIKITE